MRVKLIAGALGVVVLLYGCGNSGDSSGGSSEEVASAPSPSPQRDDDCQNFAGSDIVNLVALDNLFAPDCIVVRTTAKLTLENLGAVAHNFTVSEGKFGTSPWLFRVGDTEGGGSRTSKLEVGDVLEPGTYEFFCSLHAEGMDGVLEVVPAFEG